MPCRRMTGLLRRNLSGPPPDTMPLICNTEQHSEIGHFRLCLAIRRSVGGASADKKRLSATRVGKKKHLTKIAAKPGACLVCRRLHVPNRQRSLDERRNMLLTFIDLIGACLFGTSRDASRHKGKRVSEDSDCVDRSGNENRSSSARL